MSAAVQIGDRFSHPGDWQTEPGVWEVTRTADSCGQVLTVCVEGFHKGETSEWHALSVEQFVARTKEKAAP